MSNAAGATDPLLARALEVAADLKAKYDASRQLPKGIDLFFQDVRALDERRKQQQANKKQKGGKGKGKLKQQEDSSSSSSSSSSLALTPANLRFLKRQRTAIEPEAQATTTTTPLHPPPTPEIVILRLIELPKLLVVRIVHMLEFRELASLDTTCTKFHPFAPIGLTQLSAEMRAQWVLKPWQVKAKEVARPVQAWSRWLAEDVRWRERVVRASGGWRLATAGNEEEYGQHTLVVSKKGVVLSCGYDVKDGEENECPQLGHGEGAKSQRTLKMIEALKGKKVAQVSAGSGHSLVLTENGDVFSFGWGGLWDDGRLGHGDEKQQNLPKLVEALKGKKAVQVSAGQRHSLVLTENGDVFSFGYGGSGRLGHGDEKQQDLPKLVEALKGKKVVQVSAGGDHSLVLAENGNVFSFGLGGFGMLGHGDTKNEPLPKLVEALKGEKVVQVSAGFAHSLVLTEGGNVFSFGSGDDGMLGHRDWTDKDLPKLVEALKGKNVVQVSAGRAHSLVVTEGGDVFSFGDGSSGQLGHGDDEEQYLPKLVEALKGKTVVEVQAGSKQSVVRTKDGTVFAFGLTFEELNRDEGDDEGDERTTKPTTHMQPHAVFISAAAAAAVVLRPHAKI